MTSEIVAERGSESILGTAASTQFQPRLAPPPMRPAPPPIDPATFTAPVQAARPQPNALHTLFAAQQTQPARRKKKSKIVGFIKMLFVLAVLGGIGFAVFGFATGRFGAFGDSGDGLPTFTAAPLAYGTVTVEVAVNTDQPSKSRVVSNGDGTTLYMAFLPDSPTSPQLQVMMNDHQRFVMQPNEPVWVLQDVLGTTGNSALVKMSSVLRFEDYVPEALRPYTSVATHEKTELDGQAVTRYELHIETGRLRAERPEAYAAWLLADPFTITTTDVVARLILYVDDDGTVWRMESWSDVNPLATTSISLISYSAEPFTPNMPTSYRDDTNGGAFVQG